MKASLASFPDPILELLSDGVSRTFNQIVVELLDVTADVVFGTVFEDALHELFERHEIQMSDALATGERRCRKRTDSLLAYE